MIPILPILVVAVPSEKSLKEAASATYMRIRVLLEAEGDKATNPSQPQTWKCQNARETKQQLNKSIRLAEEEMENEEKLEEEGRWLKRRKSTSLAISKRPKGRSGAKERKR